MNRRIDDPENQDFTNKRALHDFCLKEEEWREIHDHIAGTKEYRRGLCDKLDAIRRDIQGWNARLWALALVIAIPCLTAFAYQINVNHQVEVNTQRWNKVIEKGGIR